MHHLIPFAKGMLALGRPSEVLFPKELLSQGTSLVLTGLNNTMAFQSNPDWIWPYWYEKQKDPSSFSFIPTGMNIITGNLTHRNWTSLGNPGSSKEIMVDPVGMLCIQPYGISIFPYLYIHGEYFIPPKMSTNQIQESLLSFGKKSIKTNYKTIEGLLWYSISEVKSNHEEEYVKTTYYLKNIGSKFLNIKFGITLRPYNMLSIAHINSISYYDNKWYINGKLCLILFQNPYQIRISDRHDPDPIFFENSHQKTSLKSKSGIASGICEWNCNLKTQQSELWTTKQYFTGKTDSKNLEKYPDSKSSLVIPDATLQNVWTTIKNRIHVFDDNTHFSPGTFLYHEFWLRDSSFIQNAFHQLGIHFNTHKKRKSILKTQRKNGSFLTQNGEWDGTGQAIYMLCESILFKGDKESLSSYWPAIWNGVLWINKQRQLSKQQDVPHKGMIPAGFSAEHFGPNDHYFWDNFWSLKGLLKAQWACKITGTTEQNKQLDSIIKEYQHDLDVAILNAFNRYKKGLPTSPYRKMDGASIGNLVAAVPLELVQKDTYWLKPTAEYLWRECTVDNMIYQSIIHTGLNTYLSIQLARIFLLLKDDRWKNILDSILKKASSTWTWPEAIHPLTGGGCMGDGDHGWAAAEVLTFISSLFVRVEYGILFLANYFPEEWITSNINIHIHRFYTQNGVVSWSFSSNQTSIIFKWNIERNALQKPIPTYANIPTLVDWEYSDSQNRKFKLKQIRLSSHCGEIKIPLSKDKQ